MGPACAFDKAAHLMIRFVERRQDFVAQILLERAQRRHAREFGGVCVGLVDESGNCQADGQLV